MNDIKTLKDDKTTGEQLEHIQNITAEYHKAMEMFLKQIEIEKIRYSLKIPHK